MSKRKSGLTVRQKSIIKILTQFSKENPVTIQAVSEKLNLSSRTVLREIPYIEQWLSENDFHLVRKPRVGIYLKDDEETKHFMLELLDLDQAVFHYSKQERVRLIAGDILAAEEPRKSFFFTSKYGISEGTLISDLDELEKWMAGYGLELVRKPGFGICWNGNEENYRQAVNSILVGLCDGKSIKDLRKEEENNGGHEPLLSLYEGENVKVIEEILRQTQRILKIRYTDNAFNGLLIYLMVSVTRMQQGHMVVTDTKQPNTILRYYERKEAARIAGQLEDAFQIHISREEIMFIAVQLISAKIWQPNAGTKYETENFKTRQAVIRLILKMEEKISIEFMEDGMLIDGLCNHIGPAIPRIKLNIRIENSHLSMVKHKYPKVYAATVESCDVLKEEIGVEKIPEEEIGFIAMYFCVSIEQYHSMEKKISVVVACPNGIGTSRMLAVYLEKEFPDIQIRKVLSNSELILEEEELDDIDLVISTVEIETHLKHVCVNPVLLEQDRMLIRETIGNIKKRRESISPGRTKRKKRIGRSEIAYVVTMGQEILQVVDNIKLSRVEHVSNSEELLAVAGNLFAKNDSYAVMIESDLMEREKAAGTYIAGFQMMFYHCKTEGVDHCRFGYISLLEPLKAPWGIVVGAMVMLIPGDDQNEHVYKSVIGEVSGTLAESKTLVQAMKERNREGVVKEFERNLGNYYQKVMEKNGD